EGRLDAYLTDFPSGEYIRHPKALCTPHLGASTAESEDKCAMMAVDQIKKYLLYGTIVNSVNFPMIETLPASNIKSRAIIIYKDQPGMISKITSIFGKYNINIESMRNESKGFIGYDISDTKTELPNKLVDELKTVPDVIRVRTIKL
ncbi:MAG: ACT domain-containing protein, partial [bacterium]